MLLGALASLGFTPVNAGSNDDVQVCAGHAATMLGSDDDETIFGTEGNDVIVSFGGNDVIDGRGGHDVICAGSGDDEVRGSRRRRRTDLYFTHIFVRLCQSAIDSSG